MHLSPAALDAAIRLLDGPRPVVGRGEIVEATGKSTYPGQLCRFDGS
jgi:hypothetical protein